MLSRELQALEAREVPAAAFQTLPTTPTLDPETLANLRTIAQAGRQNNLRSDVFVKVGDSNTATPEYLTNLGNPVTTSGSLPPDLAATLQTYRAPIGNTGTNSFNRVSTAATPGWTSREVARTIGGELDATRASIAIIMIGTNDTEFVPFEEYRILLENAVDQALARGVIPVLTTVPHLMYKARSSEDAAAARNQAIAELAERKKIPVINLWSGLDRVPMLGLKGDLVHLSVSPNGSGALSPADLGYGQNYRAFLVLQTLTVLQQQVFSYDPASVSASIPTFFNSLNPESHYIITGSAPGQPSVITVTDASTNQRVAQIKPFEASFLGGVQVALGDLDGDSYPDIVAGAGAGGGPAVKVFSGKTGQPIKSFFPYESSFTGGVTVAVGDMSGDGMSELAIGSGLGGGPRVRIYQNLQPTQDFLALEPNFRGGIKVAIGDFGLATSAGDSGGPIVQLFNPGSTTARTAFFAYDPNFRGGVNLGVADVNQDGEDDLLTVPGPTGGAHVRVWNPINPREVGGFIAVANTSNEGFTVAGLPGEVVVGSGSGPGQSVKRYQPSGNLFAEVGVLGENWLLDGVNLAAG